MFDHWDTEPVKVNKGAYKPDHYTAEEWKLKLELERKGDPMWEYSAYVSDLEELELVSSSKDQA